MVEIDGMRNFVYIFIYLVIFPLIGALFGFIFFSILNFLNGPLSEIALEISIAALGLFGLFAGVYGTVLLFRIDKMKKLNSNK